MSREGKKIGGRTALVSPTRGGSEGGDLPLPLDVSSVQIFGADDGTGGMNNEWVMAHHTHLIIDQRLVEQGCGSLDLEMRRIEIREAFHASEFFHTIRQGKGPCVNRRSTLRAVLRSATDQ